MSHSNPFHRHVAIKTSDYVLSKRREEAFDLSGPYLPRPLHPPLRQATLINFPVTQDRALKHFYDDIELRQFLTHFGSEKTKKENSSEVKQMRKSVERMLIKACNDQRAGTQIQYAFQGRITPDFPKRWCLTRPPQGFHGKYPLLRSTVDPKLSRDEATRILENVSACLVEFDHFLQRHPHEKCISKERKNENHFDEDEGRFSSAFKSNSSSRTPSSNHSKASSKHRAASAYQRKESSPCLSNHSSRRSSPPSTKKSSPLTSRKGSKSSPQGDRATAGDTNDTTNSPGRESQLVPFTKVETSTRPKSASVNHARSARHMEDETSRMETEPGGELNARNNIDRMATSLRRLNVLV